MVRITVCCTIISLLTASLYPYRSQARPPITALQLATSQAESNNCAYSGSLQSMQSCFESQEKEELPVIWSWVLLIAVAAVAPLLLISILTFDTGAFALALFVWLTFEFRNTDNCSRERVNLSDAFKNSTDGVLVNVQVEALKQAIESSRQNKNCANKQIGNLNILSLAMVALGGLTLACATAFFPWLRWFCTGPGSIGHSSPLSKQDKYVSDPSCGKQNPFYDVPAEDSRNFLLSRAVDSLDLLFPQARAASDNSYFINNVLTPLLIGGGAAATVLLVAFEAVMGFLGPILRIVWVRIGIYFAVAFLAQMAKWEVEGAVRQFEEDIRNYQKILAAYEQAAPKTAGLPDGVNDPADPEVGDEDAPYREWPVDPNNPNGKCYRLVNGEVRIVQCGSGGGSGGGGSGGGSGGSGSGGGSGGGGSGGGSGGSGSGGGSGGSGSGGGSGGSGSGGGSGVGGQVGYDSGTGTTTVGTGGGRRGGGGGGTGTTGGSGGGCHQLIKGKIVSDPKCSCKPNCKVGKYKKIRSKRGHWSSSSVSRLSNGLKSSHEIARAAANGELERLDSLSKSAVKEAAGIHGAVASLESGINKERKKEGKEPIYLHKEGSGVLKKLHNAVAAAVNKLPENERGVVNPFGRFVSSSQDKGMASGVGGKGKKGNVLSGGVGNKYQNMFKNMGGKGKNAGGMESYGKGRGGTDGSDGTGDGTGGTGDGSGENTTTGGSGASSGKNGQGKSRWGREDIHHDVSLSIWEIISRRYSKSAFPHLLLDQ